MIARNFIRFPEALALQLVLQFHRRQALRHAKFEHHERIDGDVLAFLGHRAGEPASVAEVTEGAGHSIMATAYSLRRLAQLGKASKRVISTPAKGRQTNTVVTYIHADHLGQAPSVFPPWLMPPLPDIDFSRRLVAGIAGFMNTPEQEQPQENVA